MHGNKHSNKNAAVLGIVGSLNPALDLGEIEVQFWGLRRPGTRAKREPCSQAICDAHVRRNRDAQLGSTAKDFPHVLEHVSLQINIGAVLRNAKLPAKIVVKRFSEIALENHGWVHPGRVKHERKHQDGNRCHPHEAHNPAAKYFRIEKSSNESRYEAKRKQM